MSCVLCCRRSDGEYCSLHKKAYENILQGYEQWRCATSVSWREYLMKLKDNPNSGTWVTDICTYLLKRGE